jgi:hypothetical protein
MAPTAAQASATYAGTFTPTTGYQGATPRHVSLIATGNRFTGLRISGGTVKCLSGAQPARTFFASLPALGGFPTFGPPRGGNLYLIFTQTTVIKPNGPWAGGQTGGTPINETGDVRLYGKWTREGYTGILAVNYAGNAEGRPTTNPNTGDPATTEMNLEAGSSCTLDEKGTLRPQQVQKAAVTSARTQPLASARQAGKTALAQAAGKKKPKPGSNCEHRTAHPRAVGTERMSVAVDGRTAGGRGRVFFYRPPKSFTSQREVTNDQGPRGL